MDILMPANLEQLAKMSEIFFTLAVGAGAGFGAYVVAKKIPSVTDMIREYANMKSLYDMGELDTRPRLRNIIKTHNSNQSNL